MNNQGFRVERCKHEDIKSLHGISVLEDAPLDMQWNGKEVGMPVQWFAAKQGDSICGVVGVAFPSARRATIWSIFVLPEWRGSSVGSILLERATSYAADCGRMRIRATSKAFRFFLSNGWTLTKWYKEQGACFELSHEPLESALTLEEELWLRSRPGKKYKNRKEFLRDYE